MTIKNNLNALSVYTADDEQLTLPIKQLVHYRNHPFELYTGERLDDLVESIKELGVITPIVVRPLDDYNKYEILSGHNRTHAATLAGLDEVPVVIKENLTDEEAAIIVTESNLIQRSFSDLKHSEKAFALQFHLNAIRENAGGQGKRYDLIKELDEQDSTSDETLSHSGAKSRTEEQAGEKYGLSKNTVSRYIRLTELTEELLEMVDDGRIPFLAGVAVSYLSRLEQTLLGNILEGSTYKLDNKKAELLKAMSIQSDHKLVFADIYNVFAEQEVPTAPSKPKSVKISSDCYSKYFADKKKEEVSEVIEKALQMYFESEG